MQIEMEVTGLAIDPVNNAPIVILREKGGARMLPIWIGVIEASAIAFELEKVRLGRPMTHDLLKSVLDQLDVVLEKVAVIDLRDNTYFACLTLVSGDRRLEIDARPSDAIALALRASAPILCEARVVDEAQARQQNAAAAEEPNAPTNDEEEEDRGEAGPRPIVPGTQSWADLLERLRPEDFGKYKM